MDNGLETKVGLPLLTEANIAVCRLSPTSAVIDETLTLISIL